MLKLSYVHMYIVFVMIFTLAADLSLVASCFFVAGYYNTIFKPGARLARFLRIASVRELLYACLCVCPPPRLSITSGVMWCDIDPIRLVE